MFARFVALAFGRLLAVLAYCPVGELGQVTGYLSDYVAEVERFEPVWRERLFTVERTQWGRGRNQSPVLVMVGHTLRL